MPARPGDEDYYIDERTQHLAQGDIFAEVYFNHPAEPEAGFVGYGMLLNYTSGMLVGAEGTNRDYKHPFRVVAPIFEVAHIQDVESQWTDDAVGGLRQHDNFAGWMYIPAYPGHFRESGVALFRPTLCTHDQIEMHRITQLTFAATRRLDSKLAKVFAGFAPDFDGLNPDMRDHWPPLEEPGA